MEQLLKLFGNSDQLLIAISVALILLGGVTPKKFVGFEVDWTAAKSAFVLLLGLCLLGFSAWHLLYGTEKGVTTANDNGRPASNQRKGTDRDAGVPARPGVGD